MLVGKLKFQLNKYTIKFIFFNVAIFVILNNIVPICSSIFNVNMFILYSIIALMYLFIFLAISMSVVGSKYFQELKFDKNKTDSIKLHIEHIEDIKNFILNNKYNKYHPNYYFRCFNVHHYCDIKNYEVFLSDMKEGNEFWIVLYHQLKSRNNQDDNIIKSLLDLDRTLYLHRRYILEDVIKIMKLKRDELFEYCKDNVELEDVENTISILYKAMELNNLIYNIDKEVVHRDMFENLFDSWFSMTVLYIINTGELLNKNLINSLIEINEIFMNNLEEFNKEKDNIKQIECQKLKDVWSVKCEQFYQLTKSISKDFKKED